MALSRDRSHSKGLGEHHAKYRAAAFEAVSNCLTRVDWGFAGHQPDGTKGPRGWWTSIGGPMRRGMSSGALKQQCAEKAAKDAEN